MREKYGEHIGRFAIFSGFVKRTWVLFGTDDVYMTGSKNSEEKPMGERRNEVRPIRLSALA